MTPAPDNKWIAVPNPKVPGETLYMSQIEVKVMQEYAAQQSREGSIALLKFLREKHFEPYVEHWADNEIPMGKYTDEQAVDLYIDHLTKKPQ